VYMLAAYSAATAIVSLAPRYYFDSAGGAVTGGKNYYTFTTTYKRYLSPQIIPPANPGKRYPWLLTGNLYAGYLLTEETGTGDILIDYWRLLFGDLCYVAPALASSNVRHYIIEGSNYVAVTADATSAVSEQGSIKGNPIMLYPNQQNHLVVLTGTLESTSIIGDDAVIERIYITPRWKLM